MTCSSVQAQPRLRALLRAPAAAGPKRRRWCYWLRPWLCRGAPQWPQGPAPLRSRARCCALDARRCLLQSLRALGAPGCPLCPSAPSCAIRYTLTRAPGPAAPPHLAGWLRGHAKIVSHFALSCCARRASAQASNVRTRATAMCTGRLYGARLSRAQRRRHKRRNRCWCRRPPGLSLHRRITPQ